MELKKGFTKVEDEESEIIVAQEMQKLSSDAVYEILVRASFSTLLRQSRWICKDWQKLIICDSKFQQTHSQRTMASGHFFEVKSSTRRNSISFVRSNNDHEEHYNSASEVESPSLDFLPAAKSTTIVGTSLHGSLLCCVTQSSSTPIPSFYICKPASREWRKIPNPKTTLKNSRIGIAVKQSSCSILHYKVLRLSQSKTGYGYHCQLFNSENWAWKKLPFVKLGRHGLKQGDGIWVNGGLHWLTSDNEVVVFNTDQEKWTAFEVSPEMKNISVSYRVAVSCDGKLGVIYQTTKWMEIWILEDYSTTNPSWKRKYSNDMRSLHQNVEHVCCAHHMWTDNTVMMMSMYELVAFNCDSNTYTRTKLPKTADLPFAFQPQFCYL
ncbi:hypothetical protein C5167_043555 [Papaver somniferum]|uniref:Uncharacterized protein n=1 Tax=Papaver somniferum TaxID=3469 RepID=A0A4Y7L929_PAPSO|nr:uncharacterized protein LOC113317088 [Papaver somniferum]RZC80978.1 hypothetical protein C5167_043555 [Papaver somniferum]